MSFGFGSSFGQTSFGTTASPAKGFGQSGFGFGSSSAPATTAPTFVFGSTATSTAPTGFGSTTGTSFGAFGSGFSSTTTAPAFTFNAPATTTTQSLFSGFGQTATTASAGFGGIGVVKPFSTGAPTFSGFGTTPSVFGTGSSFGFSQPQQLQPQPQQLQQQQAPAGPNDAVLNSFICNIYGDERDQIITKWNLLQALWGTGKGYYSQNAPPVDYTPQNIMCRLKAIVYSKKSTCSNSEALVAICVNKNTEDIRTQQAQFEASIQQSLGNKPNISVHVDCIRPISESKSLVLIYVLEKYQNGTSRRISNNEVCSYLIQPTPKQQLVNMGVDNLYCFSLPKEDQIAEYLENPPVGIDPGVWKKAQSENPNPSSYIPVPLIGFNDVKWRLKCQENEAKVHETILNTLSEKVSNLYRQQITNDAKLKEYKQNLLLMEHRILKIYVALSEQPNAVFGPEEEALKARLQDLYGALNKPQYFKNRVSEIISALRLQDSQKKPENVIDDATLADIKEFLEMQFKAINRLKEVIDYDTKTVSTIENEMKKFPPIE